MATYTRTYGSSNDMIAPSDGYSIYVIDGGAGSDTFYADTGSSGFTISAMDGTGVTTVSGASGTTIKLSNVEKISFKDGKSFTLQTLSANTLVQGTSGNDMLTGTTGNNTIDGGAGIDTVLLTSISKSGVSISHGSNWTISSTSTGSDTLSNVERIQFQNTKLALDLDGHAGQAAKILGAVFGKAAVANKEYVGIGLNMLDGGTSYEAVAQLAVSVTGKTSNADIVSLLWTNVIGTAPSAAQAQPFIDMLNSGTSVGALTTMAADTSFNQSNINLVGLSQTGLEFL
jgi:Ca2+-binding RTX toxin-like protein